jgi:hypothetical protein
MSNPRITVPNVITERYLADLSRQVSYLSSKAFLSLTFHDSWLLDLVSGANTQNPTNRTDDC